MGLVHFVTPEEHQALMQEVKALREFVALWIDNTDDEIKGYEAAAKFSGVSVSTLEKLVRRRLISFKKEGKAVSFSRKVLVAYKQSRRINTKSAINLTL